MHFFQIFTCGLKEQSLFRVFVRGEISQGNWRGGGHMSRNILFSEAKTQKTVTSLRWADAYVTWLFTTLVRAKSTIFWGGGEEKLRINSRINELCRLAVNHTFTWVGVICWVHLIPHSLLQLCGRAGSHCSPAANYWNNYTFLHGDSMTQLPLCTICSQVVDNSAGEGCERLKQIACPVWSNSSTWWLCSGGARWRQWLHHSVSLAFECH